MNTKALSLKIFLPIQLTQEKKEALHKIMPLIESLKEKKYSIIVYNYQQNEEQYWNNQIICHRLVMEGEGLLPITMLSDEIKKIGDFPNNLEIAEWLDIPMEELIQIIKDFRKQAGVDCNDCMC